MQDKQDRSDTVEENPEWRQKFQQCLELLRGPGDERKFVGLLLVTRLLPHGSDDAVRRVLDALGTEFLHRLLLRLCRPPGQVLEPLPPEAAEQQATCCSLALAILAAACRLQDFAAGPDVRELLPVLIKVVQCGGILGVLQPGSASAAATDAAAVCDALECLVGSVAAAPEQTCRCLEHLPVMEAVADWLTAAAAALTSAPPTTAGGADRNAAAEVELQRHNSVLLTAGLIERLLAGSGGGGRGRTTVVLAEHPAASARVMAALSALIGNPRLLLSPATTATHGSSSASPQPQQPQQQLNGSGDHPIAQSGQKDASGGISSSSSSSGAAQLQLEALHLLLLMLRACQEPAAAAAAQELVRLDEQVAWSAAVRCGLGWLLRSRVPGPLKQSALQLAALVVEVTGERWLLGPRMDAGSAAAAGAPPTSAAQEPAGSFLVLLIETLKIETGLLLQDALHPGRPVPAVDAPRSASSLGQPPQSPAPSQRLLDELAARAAQRKAAEEAAVQAAAAAAARGDGARATAASPTPLPALVAPLEDMDVDGGPSAEPSPRAQREAPTPPASAAAPVTMPAGNRALALLPACFRLLEGCVEAVAADAAAADGRLDEDVGKAAARTHGSAPPLPPQPVLSDAALQKLMGGLDGIADTLLQFFEAVHEQQQQQRQEERRQQPQQLLAQQLLGTPEAAAAGSPVPVSLLLGAARVLGRYLAEAPSAVRSARLLRALPEVMAVRADGGGGAGVEEEEEEEGGFGGFALAFLLPGLLQATGPGAEDRSETASALRSAPAALGACVAFLAHCVGTAVAAVPHAEGLLAAATRGAGGVTGAGASGAAALAALVRSEQGMADVSMLLLNLLEPPVLGPLAVGRGLAPNGPGAAGGGGLDAWEVLRRCSVASSREGGSSREATAAAAAAAASLHLPPLLAPLLTVCWLLQRWSASRELALRGLSSADPLHLPSQVADQLFRWQLGTRALLCTSCLAAVLAAAAMARLASGGDDAVAAAAVLLPSDVVEAVGTTALAAVAAGASMQLSQLHDASVAAAVPPPPPPALGQLLPLTAAGLAEDFAGDGELCWERLCAATAQLVEMSPAVRRLAAAGPGPGPGLAGGSSAATWLRQLAAARAHGDPAAEELLLSAVNLAALLQVVSASAHAG